MTQRCHLVPRGTVFAEYTVRNIYDLFIFPSDFRRWKRPFLYAQDAESLTALQARSHPPHVAIAK